jgi:catechol 2,3-dioxygenase-like lactoylglutathione lyase family enzyme
VTVLGIDEITFGASDLPKCKQFFLDWGLQLASEAAQELVFESINGCRVVVAHSDKAGLPAGVEPDPTLREIVWGVAKASDLEALRGRLAAQPGFVDTGKRIGCTDPSGLAVRLQVSVKRAVDVSCAQTNTWTERSRINQPSPAYDRATPIEVGHVVFFVKNLAQTTQFYTEQLGFVMSDQYPGRGAFLRCAADGGHHDLFLLQPPEPRSSAIFWYFNNPAGALVEYYTDEDQLTADWQPREFTPGPTVFAEWAIAGGIDGNTRRQVNAAAPTGRFMTDKPKP